MKLLVTGLCMQGNKGGPAIALALAHAIRREPPDVEFVFSVPGGPDDWPFELEWAKRYGFRVIQRLDLSYLIPPFCFKKGRWRQFRGWWRELRGSDALVQMSAVCYIGPPAGSGDLRSVLFSHRVFDFVLSLLAQRRMIAWTQSYGPFSSWPVRLFARMDLRRQPIVFCRGDACRTEVQKLLPGTATVSFPDVALTLPYDAAWGRSYLGENFSVTDSFVTVSPSAVLYTRAEGDGRDNRHVVDCSSICAELMVMGFAVLLVPHTLRGTRSHPTRCDLAVAREVLGLASDSQLMLVEDDLSPSELKSVIANAEMHIGARYHSVVAALSAGVPAISLSWHDKYLDLMSAYGLEDLVLDEKNLGDATGRIAAILANRSAIRERLAERQLELERQVGENVKLFCRLLRE